MRWFSIFCTGKSPEIFGDYGKLRYLRPQIPGLYRAIIFPSPDRLVRRHPVWVAESCVKSCNSVWISKTIGKGVWFSIRFNSFFLYISCKRLCDFEEIEISRQSCRGDCEWQGGKLLSGFRLRIRPPAQAIMAAWYASNFKNIARQTAITICSRLPYPTRSSSSIQILFVHLCFTWGQLRPSGRAPGQRGSSEANSFPNPDMYFRSDILKPVLNVNKSTTYTQN